MSRDHARHGHQHGHGAPDNAAGMDPIKMAQMQRASDRKKAGGGHAAEQSNVQGNPHIAEVRHKLRDKVTHELKETMYAAMDEAQSMIRADERADAVVSASFTKALGDKAADFLTGKALELVRDSFELGEGLIAGAIEPAFSTAKSALEGASELSAKLKASEAVDVVVKTVRQQTDHVCAALGSAVDKIPDGKMAEIAGCFEQFENIKSDSDSEATGSLKHGLDEWLMEKMGAPATGGKAIHDHAVELYEVYRVEVAKCMSASEQVDEAKDAMSGATHAHAEEEAGKAEERLGLTGEVESDTIERKRTEQL